MKDGSTKQLQRPRSESKVSGQFLRDFDVRLIAVSGASAGTEYCVTRERMTLGRGPGVDLAFDDQSMSRQHAILEVSGRAVHVRDLGSTNGVQRNGAAVQSAELAHGDRLRIGKWTFQVLIESRSEASDTYELPAEF